MGIFDTIVFDKPIICPTCGNTITSTQTKELDPSMAYYRLGDFIEGTLDKIFKEDIFCCKCKNCLENEFVYIAIKRGILVGIERTYEDAIKTTENFDKRIYDSLISNCKEKNKVKRNFNQLSNKIFHLKEYYKNLTDPKYTKFNVFFEMFQEDFRNNSIIKNLEVLLESAKKMREGLEKEE